MVSSMHCTRLEDGPVHIVFIICRTPYGTGHTGIGIQQPDSVDATAGAMAAIVACMHMEFQMINGNVLTQICEQFKA